MSWEEEKEVRECIVVALGICVGVLLLSGGIANNTLAFAMFAMGMFVAYN